MNAPDLPDPAIGRSEGRPIADGARAAGLLEATARSATPEDSLQLETVRGLARDLGRQLDALDRLSHEGDEQDVLVEAALRCADLATLAACAVPRLPADDARGSPAEAARIAANAVRDLGSSAESWVPDGERAENLLRDLRSGAWRADLAARQVVGPSEEVSP